MGLLSDIGSFELFHTKDVLNKIKQNPERLLLGGFGTDPFSAKITNKALGTNYEPLVDQFGGAYGGHTVSAFGNQDGGVYKRARDAGINVGPGASAQDVAHVVAAMYAGNYGAGKLGIGGGAGGGLSEAFSGGSALGPAEGGASGGLLGGAGGGGMAQQGMGLLGGGQQQQPQTQQVMPPPQQNTESAQLKMIKQMQLQALRQKPNKTVEDYMQMQQISENQGLLG